MILYITVLSDKQIQVCLHFHQQSSLKHDTHHVFGSGNQTPTWLGNIINSSISRGLNALFSEDVDGKTSDKFTIKQCSFHKRKGAK